MSAIIERLKSKEKQNLEAGKYYMKYEEIFIYENQRLHWFLLFFLYSIFVVVALVANEMLFYGLTIGYILTDSYHIIFTIKRENNNKKWYRTEYTNFFNKED